MTNLPTRLLRVLRTSKAAYGLRSVIPERIRPIGYLNYLTRQKSDCTVMAGPFAGMRYITHAHGSTYIPKLLGIYERELTAEIEAIVQRQPKRIVDLGAAEGYYAVGMALRLPNARVVAFEMDKSAQIGLEKLASLNQVLQRLEIHGYCDPQQLRSALENEADCVLICDVEGHESILLDPEIIPQLIYTPILVELHDFIVAGTTETLLQRFQNSHSIKHIWQEEEPRCASEFPWRTFWTSLLPKWYLDEAVSEMRPVRMSWLWMVPKQLLPSVV